MLNAESIPSRQCTCRVAGIEAVTARGGQVTIGQMKLRRLQDSLHWLKFVSAFLQLKHISRLRYHNQVAQ